MRRRDSVVGGFVEHEISKDAFEKMDAERKLIVQRYSIPLPPTRNGWVRFKMTRHWSQLAFPYAKDHY